MAVTVFYPWISPITGRRTRPDAAAPWNLRRVVHLHRRAGFAGTWTELQRDLRDGPTASIDRLLAGRASLHAPAEFADTAELLADTAVAAGDINRLRAAWFYRIVFGPDPLAGTADTFLAQSFRHRLCQGG